MNTHTPTPTATVTFTSNINRETTYMEHSLGDHVSVMDYWDGCDAGHAMIEWIIESLDTVEHIGLTFGWIDGKRTLCDYDGVFSLPIQACTLMESVGIIVPDEFKE